MKPLLIFAAMTVAYGQSASFEVISIKPAPPSTMSSSAGGPGSKDPGRWVCNNLSPWNLLLIAFNLRPNDLSGPDWIHESRFDINAKVPQGATREQFREMMQNMLVERFGLKYHREKKDVPGYELLVAKGRPKFKESDPNAPESQEPGIGIASADGSGVTMGANGFPEIPPGRRGVIMAGDRVRLQLVRTTLDALARSLSQQVGRPVTNGTGLAGVYDVSLYWVRPMPGAAPPGPDVMPVASDPAGPSLFTALQAQLGLKLEARKVMAEILVVDDMRKVPTEN